MATDRSGEGTRQGKPSVGGSSRRQGPPGPARSTADYHMLPDGLPDERGMNVAFPAEEAGLRGKVEACLTYDAHKSPDDLLFHLAAFLLDDAGKVPRLDPYFSVHHAWIRSKDLSLFRQGRRPHGTGSLDETITADLSLVLPEITRIVFVAYIQTGVQEHKFADVYDGLVTFSEVQPDGQTHVFHRHELNSDYGEGLRAVVIGKLARRQTGHDDWVFIDSGEPMHSLIEAGAEFGVPFV